MTRPVLYRVAAYDVTGRRGPWGVFQTEERARDFAATLIDKHERVEVSDDTLELVALWVDSEERPCARVTA